MPIVLIAALFVVSRHLRDQDDGGAGGDRDADDRRRRSATSGGGRFATRARRRSPRTRSTSRSARRCGSTCRTADVIHSFWVPRLNRKIDMIPGQTNASSSTPTRPDATAAQCDEFCGLQHAHMAFYVFADPPAVFRRWLADQARPAAARRRAAAQASVFFLVGVRAAATRSAARGDRLRRPRPDAPRRRARRSRALTIPNTRCQPAPAGSSTRRHVKPGNQMPTSALTPTKLAGARRVPRGAALMAIATPPTTPPPSVSSASSGCGRAGPASSAG